MKTLYDSAYAKRNYSLGRLYFSFLDDSLSQGNGDKALEYARSAIFSYKLVRQYCNHTNDTTLFDVSELDDLIKKAESIKSGLEMRLSLNLPITSDIVEGNLADNPDKNRFVFCQRREIPENLLPASLRSGATASQ